MATANDHEGKYQFFIKAIYTALSNKLSGSELPSTYVELQEKRELFETLRHQFSEATLNQEGKYSENAFFDSFFRIRVLHSCLFPKNCFLFIINKATKAKPNNEPNGNVININKPDTKHHQKNQTLS
ncbi:hypothetical protein KFE80_12155 [bacterium SCSIO 12696]|nr:hypothetical protein KFE80_12155 [bacterium SCSIO 12696]